MKRMYSDKTLMGMTKADLVQQVKDARHNQVAAEERLAQQAENVKDWVPVRYGRWEEYTHSRFCGVDEDGDPVFRDGVVYVCSNPKCKRKTVVKEKYCPSCGATMDLEGQNG